MKINIFILLLLNLIQYGISQKVNVDLLLEYPYTCGTWFNRGKNTCRDIIEKLEKNNFQVNSSIKSYHKGDVIPNYNGEFNIYLNKEGKQILLATSDERSAYYHTGLKYFAYTFYKIDNGEKNYLAEYPQKEELLNFVLKRTIQAINNNLK